MQDGGKVRCLLFLSTPSARRATQPCKLHLQRFCISIHALREEGDAQIERVLHFLDTFLSTPSARRATAKTEKASPLLIKV